MHFSLAQFGQQNADRGSRAVRRLACPHNITCMLTTAEGKEEGPVYALHPGSRSHWVHMMNEPRYEDYVWKTTNRNKFAYLGNGFSIREVEGGDLTWYMDHPEEGYNSIRY